MSHEIIMKELVKRIVRCFYEPHHCVIMDILLEKVILYDNELCQRMKMLSKEFNKLVVKLREDKLVKHETKIETKPDGRQILRTVYYVDYGEIKDVIKYKIFKMTKILDTEIRNSEKMQGYACSSCFKEFSVLDAQCLMDNFTFKCDECGGELGENRKKGVYNDPHELHTLLMVELNEIITLLKEVDKFSIPTIDYFQVLEIRKEKESKKEKGISQAAPKIDAEVVIAQEMKENKDFIEDIVVPKNTDLNSLEFYKKEVETTDNNSEVITVSGVEKLFSQITDEDKEKMNEEEYEKYFEIYSKYDSLENV